MTRIGWILGGAATAALLLFLVDRDDGAPDRTASPAAPGATPGPESEARGPLYPLRTTPPRPEPASRKDRVSAEAARHDFERRKVALVDLLRADVAARAIPRRDRPQDADEKSVARREAAAAARDELIASLKGTPDLVFDLLAEMDRTNEDRVVRQLGRLLRFVRTEALVKELRVRARQARRPADRQAALLGLEGRAQTAWLDVTTDAYRKDDAPPVRDTAANVLGRALPDPKFLPERTTIRGTLRAGLADPDPDGRIRTLYALVLDVHDDDATRKHVEPLRKDPDAKVRDAARRVERILEQRKRR